MTTLFVEHRMDPTGSSGRSSKKQVTLMAMSAQHIADDYERLKELCELYPNISLIQTEGQPPDCYEIEYRLHGYVKAADGAIGIGQTHRVRLNLPFGYPHFPPIAKPLTPIFHPDIDPAAIRLADHWQHNPSLPDLILYIGEMICGGIYHLEEPFNQEAAEWYERHQQELPLDSLRVANIEESDDRPDPLIDDTLDALTLGLEKEASPEPVRRDVTENLHRIRELIAQKYIFSANELMAEIPASADFPDREPLQQTIGKALRKTDQLFKLAEQLEEVSKFEEAMEVVDNLLAIAVDAPGADALRSRIHQSSQQAQLFSAVSDKSERLTTQPESKTPIPPPAPIASRGNSLAGFNAIPFKSIVAAILVLAVSIAAISLYFKDQNTLSQSQANLLEGQMLIDKKEFHNALEALEKGKALLADLTILRYRKSTQEKAIEALITSSELQEGLQGRVLYQGEYVPAAYAIAQEELTKLTDQAQTLAGQNRLLESLALYRQALKFATEHTLSKQQTVLHDIIQSLELRHTLAVAEQAEHDKNWDEAAAAYRKALTLSGKMNNLGTASDITHRLTAAAFRHDLDQSKKAFTQSQWRETIKYLEQAQHAINANPNVVTEKERQDLHRLLVNSRLYLMLSTAREAYQQKNWEQAITEYQNALSLLGSESQLEEMALGESLGKIEKTLLLVKISQIQDVILVAESKGDNATVLAQCREIQRLIKTSNYQNDPAVVAVSQKMVEKIAKQQELMVQNEKIAWLETHYEEIFRANYPTFKNSKLMQPKAVFMKYMGAKMIFTLSCVERSQGSTSKLELNYQFDPASGKWSAHTD